MLSGLFDPHAMLEAAYARFFEHIQIDDRWLRIVKDAAGRGPVVYVLRSLSFLDFMALEYLTRRHGLPRLGFANELGLWVFEPFSRSWRQAMFPSQRVAPEQRLATVIRAGGSAALFLKRPSTMRERAAGHPWRAVSLEGDTLVRTLFDLQAQIDRPIMLVPQVFVWSKRPESLAPSALDMVLGPQDWPGRLRLGTQFLANYRNVMLRAGEPLVLSDFLQANAGEPLDTLVRRINYALMRRVERERRAILGPMRKPADRVRDEIIRSPKLQRTIRQLAGEGSTERMLLTARAYGMLRQLEAAPDPETIFAMSTLLGTALNVMYAGLELDREGLERVRQASQQGTVVLLPSHKSHVDYLLLSHVLRRHSLQLPLIAAGDNLSFFPLGMLLRRGGAFFIRRSFKGDRLYAAVVDAYLRRILRDGWPIEFFLEGTRARNGKLLEPKLGLLSMIVDSGLALPANRDVLFVPVSIGYERLVEEGSYVRELLGAEKTKESPTALLRATRVLAERYGRLNVQFGQVLSLRQAAIEAGAVNGPPTPAQRRAVTKRIAYRVMSRINDVTAATPGAVVALALLSHERRGLSHAELVMRVQRLVSVLRQKNARMTPALATSAGTMRPACVRETLAMFEQAGLIERHLAGQSLAVDKTRRRSCDDEDIVYSVPENKRLALDISKNIIIHFFVAEGLLAMAMLAPPGPPISLATVHDRAQRMSQLFKHEFMFDPDLGFEGAFQATVDAAAARREIAIDGDHVTFGEGHDGLDGRGWIALYSSMLRNFFESYLVAARSLCLLLKGPLPPRELVRRALAIGDKMYLAGEIERREALSGKCLENAFESLLEEGYLNHDDKRLALASSFADPETVRTIEARIGNYLSRRAADRE